MTLKSILSVAVAATLFASSAMAQTISVDLQRDGMGLAQLDANGDWVWEVTYNADADGGAASIELGATFADSEVISGSVTTTGEGGGDVETANPGNAIFGWEALNGDGNPEGLQVDPAQGSHGQAFYAHGTGIVAGSSSLLLGTFTTDGPNTTMGESLTSSISIVGAYDAAAALVGVGGTHGIVGQSSGATAVNASGSATALPGDANLDGNVNFQDAGIVSGNFNASPRTWATGDFNGDGLVNFQDAGVLSGGFNMMGPAPVTATPEPSAMFLMLMAGLLGVARRARR